jgi:hypothetical protein
MPQDQLQMVFLAVAAAVVIYQMISGWRKGLVRQLFNLVALIGAYAAAYFGGRLAIPVLRPMGYPDIVAGAAAGALIGILVFVGVSSIGAILFKKTSQQSVGIIRFAYGLSGALVGVLFGLFFVWMAVVAVRVLGTVAETKADAAKNIPAPRVSRLNAEYSVTQEQPQRMPPETPNALIRGLVEMKHSLEWGKTGKVVDRVDPVPEGFYSVMHKLGQMAASPERVNRFLAYPGAKPLTEHPKILALRDDPEIFREIESRNFLALIKNERIVNAANDPDLNQLLRDFELEKALDYALQDRM